MKRAGGIILVKVTLHRGMPSSHINLEPTKTHFYLDTLKNSKKIRIGPTPYPNDVEVDPEAAEASMEGHQLLIKIPISEGQQPTKAHAPSAQEKTLAWRESRRKKAQKEAELHSRNMQLQQQQAKQKEKQRQQQHDGPAARGKKRSRGSSEGADAENAVDRVAQPAAKPSGSFDPLALALASAKSEESKVSAKLEKEKQKLAAFAKQAAVQQERRDAKKQRKEQLQNELEEAVSRRQSPAPDAEHRAAKKPKHTDASAKAVRFAPATAEPKKRAKAAK